MTKKVLISLEDILLIKGGRDIAEAVNYLSALEVPILNSTHLHGFMAGFNAFRTQLNLWFSDQPEVKDEESTD